MLTIAGKARTISIKLFNTLTKRKEDFSPIKAGEVGLYACGPTVYNYASIGNLRSYLMVDLLNRTLQANGLNVNLVINITDVGHLVADSDEGDDKMELGAKREQLSAWQVAQKYEKAFVHDLAQLNIIKPNSLPKATDNIPEMIKLIEQIMGNGFAYKTDDGIYFDTSLDSNYGDLAGLKLDGQEQAERDIVVTQKRNPADFALWKFSPTYEQREMEWDSPWGKGFPGWHIECSAMSQKFLGLPFDIHFGGIDHIPVHHTNEIAQTKAATGHILANFWLHNEFLLVDGRKMSKSLDNIYTLSDLLEKGFNPAAFRHLILSANYHDKLNFTWQSLESSQSAISRLSRLVNSGEGEPDPEGLKQALGIMNDDLASPRLLAFLEEKNNPWLWLNTQNLHGLDFSLEFKDEVKLTLLQKELLAARQKARREGDYARADEIRLQLKAQNILVSDSDEGQTVAHLN